MERAERSQSFALLQAGERHWDLLAELLQELTHPSGSLFFDIRTGVLMREHGVRAINTTDTDFLQIPGIKVINPSKFDPPTPCRNR